MLLVKSLPLRRWWLQSRGSPAASLHTGATCLRRPDTCGWRLASRRPLRDGRELSRGGHLSH
eukprot:scaffold1085_cov407-Prasinococcus_capsulatus_cf.AAC.47